MAAAVHVRWHVASVSTSADSRHQIAIKSRGEQPSFLSTESANAHYRAMMLTGDILIRSVCRVEQNVKANKSLNATETADAKLTKSRGIAREKSREENWQNIIQTKCTAKQTNHANNSN